MEAAVEGASFVLFHGKAINSNRAADAVFRLVWARHQENLPDVGTWYNVYPKGAQNVEYCPLEHIFGQ